MLFGLGIVAIITRRNVIYILMGLEMILNAANINFVAFNRFGENALDGRMFAIFTIILAAAEAAVRTGLQFESKNARLLVALAAVLPAEGDRFRVPLLLDRAARAAGGDVELLEVIAMNRQLADSGGPR